MVIDYVYKFSVIPQLIYVNLQGRRPGGGLGSSQMMISALIKAIKIFGQNGFSAIKIHITLRNSVPQFQEKSILGEISDKVN